MAVRISVAASAMLLLSLTGCDNAQAAKELVSSDFHDPASAQWRNVRVVDADTGEQWVCGEVNAKSLAGTYMGFRGFVANVKQSLAVIEPGAEFAANPLNAHLAAVNYEIARGFCNA